MVSGVVEDIPGACVARILNSPVPGSACWLTKAVQVGGGQEMDPVSSESATRLSWGTSGESASLSP